MKNTRLIYFWIFAIGTLGACAQSPKGAGNTAYDIDPGIQATVEKKVKTVNAVTTSELDFRMFENDRVIGETYTNGNSVKECMILASLDGDTINITGFLGMFAGFGYQIALFKDTCVVRHFIKSDAEIYKLAKADSLSFGVSVPCKTYKLTLTRKPTFKKGDRVEGIIELMSEEYYEVANGNEKKYKMQLTGYFKTDAL